MSNLNDNASSLSSEVFSNLTSMRFPLKVYHMLECGKYNHIINWLPDGTSFSILDEALLVRDVLPFYCPGAQYETFIRQLNKYGLETLEKRKKTDIGRIFSSALFIRGREDLLLTMQRTGAKPSSKTKAEVAPSMPNKRSRPTLPLTESAHNNPSIIDSFLSDPSFHNLGSFHTSAPIEPAVEPIPSHITSGSAGLWLAQKVMVTRVIEHVKYTLIPHDLLSEPLHSSALQTAVANASFSPEQLLSRSSDPVSCSSAEKAHESSTVLESRFSPVEYAVARTPLGLKWSVPDTNTHSAVPDSTSHTMKWPQQLLQTLGMSNEVVIAIGSTTLDSAVIDITAALTAVQSAASSVQSPQIASYEQHQEEEGKGQSGTTVDTAGKK